MIKPDLAGIAQRIEDVGGSTELRAEFGKLVEYVEFIEKALNTAVDQLIEVDRAKYIVEGDPDPLDIVKDAIDEAELSRVDSDGFKADED